MNRRIKPVLFLAALAVVLPFGVAVTAGTQAPWAGQFDWLEGEWERPTQRGLVIERWRPAEGVGLVGESIIRPSDGSDEFHTEAALLVEMGADIYYIPRPRENPYPVAFRLVSLDESTAVFENPTHDFPQSIVYERTAPDAMTVTIEGPGDGGETQQIEFHFTRRPGLPGS